MNRALKVGILEGGDSGMEAVPEAIKAMRAGEALTPDLGGRAGTGEMGDAIAAAISDDA